MSVLEGEEVQQLARIVEESTRSTREGVKYFLEPAPGTLSRAKNKRHHIIFGRRGSGKSSLLGKVRSDLTVDRRPIAYVDLEEFKGHSYPDVLLSILIKTLAEFKNWMDTAATAPANKSSFWEKFFGSKPTAKALDKKKVSIVSASLNSMIDELNESLFSADESKNVVNLSSEKASGHEVGASLGAKVHVVTSEIKTSESYKELIGNKLQSEYTSKKIEILHRNIMRYKKIFEEISLISDGPSFLLLDDLYHIRISDQAHVLDYFHRIAKGANLWLKVGTIRHRSKWYVYGDPPIGIKLGDDADEIDLDVTLEKYDLTKIFLLKILSQFARESGLKLDTFISDGAKDRLVLASGGVARDFLTIFRRAIDVARERIAAGDHFRGHKVGAEDVNRAAGENDKFKREDFSRDAGKDEGRALLNVFEQVTDFCISNAKSNCFLVEKDVSDQKDEAILELVDLKFLHHVKSRVTIRDRPNRVYDAYMLDLSQYAGERARRNFEIVEFWGKNADDSLRKTRFILLERMR